MCVSLCACVSACAGERACAALETILPGMTYASNFKIFTICETCMSIHVAGYQKNRANTHSTQRVHLHVPACPAACMEKGNGFICLVHT